MRLLSCFILFLLWLLPASAKASVPSIQADSAILIEEQSGEVLFSLNPQEARPIASTTKIMTALIALQFGDLDKVIPVSAKAADTGESSINLQEGEELSLQDLLYGALMRSGNDACVAIAENVAGSEELFVALMNRAAQFYGARQTHFHNTNGLPDQEHYSCARDLALFTQQAFQYPLFSQIVASRSQTIGSRSFTNTNALLWSYAGADGVKTGTTNAAGKCLVASATRDDCRLIAVILHSSDRYGDAQKLLDFGFQTKLNLTTN